MNIAEAAIIIAIVIAIGTSFTHDHEGEWVDLSTGKVFHIHGALDKSAYDRWHGRIHQKGAILARVSSGASHPLNWITVRNLFRDRSVVGNWFGTTKSGSPIYMHISPEFSVILRRTEVEHMNGYHTDDGIKMTNHLNETFWFTGGGRTGTLAIHNSDVIMKRIE